MRYRLGWDTWSSVLPDVQGAGGGISPSQWCVITIALSVNRGLNMGKVLANVP